MYISFSIKVSIPYYFNSLSFIAHFDSTVYFHNRFLLNFSHELFLNQAPFKDPKSRNYYVHKQHISQLQNSAQCIVIKLYFYSKLMVI